MKEVNTGHFNSTHGLAYTRFYYLWCSMKQRCNRPQTNGYKNYGGRGIKVCEEWHTFINFMNDMYESYTQHATIHGEKNTSLDRIDTEKDYCKENCKWATNIEQHNNTRSTVWVTVDGVTDSLPNHCRRYNAPYTQLYDRQRRKFITDGDILFAEYKNRKVDENVQ